MGKQELAAQVLAKHYSWAGHVARMHGWHIAAHWGQRFTTESWKLQQAIGETIARRGRKWRHPKPGPVRRWDGLLHRVLGGSWQVIAHDRDKWKSAKANFVSSSCSLLLGTGHRVFGVADV